MEHILFNSVITPEQMTGSSQHFYRISNNDTWHNTQVFDFTYFLKVREVKVCLGPMAGHVCNHLGLLTWNFVHITNYAVYSAVLGVLPLCKLNNC
jgi:hypothetical protein